jgi:hypothetical protein
LLKKNYRQYIEYKKGIPEDIKFMYNYYDNFENGETLEEHLFEILQMVKYE